MKALAIALNTFRESIRNKILYSVVLFACVIVGVSAIFGAVTIGDQVKVIKDFGLFSLSFAGALIAIISGVNLLNKELKQKTIYNILSKPIPRWQFILGKHLGLSLTVSLLVAIMGTGLIYFTYLLEGSVDWFLWQGVYFAILEVILVSSITIFFSSVVVTTTLTGLFTLGTYIGGRSIGYLAYFIENDETAPLLIRHIISALYWVLPDFRVLNYNNTIVYGVAVDAATALQATLYTLSYSGVVLVIASLIFSKREML